MILFYLEPVWERIHQHVYQVPYNWVHSFSSHMENGQGGHVFHYQKKSDNSFTDLMGNLSTQSSIWIYLSTSDKLHLHL